MERYDVGTRKAARALNARMESAVANVATFEEWAPAVIETARGCGGAVWLCYDDAGGNAHSWIGPSFYKVRQVRNSAQWGPLLTKAVNHA